MRAVAGGESVNCVAAGETGAVGVKLENAAADEQLIVVVLAAVVVVAVGAVWQLLGEYVVVEDVEDGQLRDGGCDLWSMCAHCLSSMRMRSPRSELRTVCASGSGTDCEVW